MRRIRFILFSILALVVSDMAIAQKSSKRHVGQTADQPQKSFVELLREDYDIFYKNGGFFEKLYLMTDKPYYSAGEVMYFSGFLVQSTLFTRISDSEFIYVELISPEGRLVERHKVCADHKQFIGNFNLSARLTSGKYVLRAYSRWMTNFDAGYFFTKEIYIGNYIDDAIMTDVTYRFNDNNTISAFVRFSDQYALPIVSTQVKYRAITDNKTRNGSGKTDKAGEIEIRFKPSENPNDCIEVNIRANSRELSRFIQMPSFSDDYDVQFCPEGGNLISGITQIVAFKAQRSNGRSLEIEGKLYDQDGTFLSDITTEYKGMGRFILRPSFGHKYYAEFTNKDGLKKRFELPAVAQEGVTVRVIRKVSGHMFLFQGTKNVDLRNYVAVLHSRGAIMTVLDDLTHTSSIRSCDMFDGIGQVSIVDRISRKIVCERLFYVMDNRFASAAISTDKLKYEQRDKVVMTVNVKTSDGKPAQGNFAMSVTDSNVVDQSYNTQSIFSYMLLSSDLKGDIEDPGSYFVDDNVASLEKLELLMLTNGWRRYPLQKIIDRELPRIMYPIEDSQRIMGSVFGLFGRAKKPSVVVMNPKTKYVNSFELNESNNFIISGLDAYSTATYIVQALNKRGHDRTVRIKIESENYPAIITEYKRDHYKSQKQIIPETFLTRAKEKYFEDGGERVIDIEEIVVMAKKRTSPFFASGNTGSLLNGDLSGYGSVTNALATFKELNVNGTTITTKPRYVQGGLAMNAAATTFEDASADQIAGEDSGDASFVTTIASMDDDLYTPELYVNGSVMDISDCDNYDIKYVERLAFVDGRAATMLGISAPAGAILMEVSPEGLRASASSDAMAQVVVRAANKPEAFYKPKYATFADRIADKKDIRSTITWEPFIRTDANGLATIVFYTADRSSRYDVVLEGVTDDGELCRTTSAVDVVYKPLK